MKYSVRSFKNLQVCLQELKPYICNGDYLETGRPFNQFGDLRLREIFANWLLCVVINFEQKSDRCRVCTDPLSADGVIYDELEKRGVQTEHVLVSRNNKDLQDIESLILKHIAMKQNKAGAAYASGKILVVFLNKVSSEWYPNRVVRELPGKLDFEEVWVMGLHNIVDREYNYNIIKLT